MMSLLHAGSLKSLVEMLSEAEVRESLQKEEADERVALQDGGGTRKSSQTVFITLGLRLEEVQSVTFSVAHPTLRLTQYTGVV